MKISDLDYILPDELIAQRPLDDRAAARLLHLEIGSGKVHHRRFLDAVDLLEPGDVLVLNDTRVTALRIYGRRRTGARVEALLLERGENPGEYIALMRPGKRLMDGEEIMFEDTLPAKIVEDRGYGRKLLRFLHGAAIDDELAKTGRTPLPPYIKTHLDDPSRYQTVYARTPGSVAAPTAGLHFTNDVLKSIEAKGVKTAYITLDVSIDTFRPVTAETVEEHRMHGEHLVVSPESAETINGAAGRIIAVGTTTVRTLESMAVGKRKVAAGERVSDLFITPGYEFKVVDGMFTNFHLPRTTMLLMISALAGRDSILDAYQQAVAERYRFLSFGDSMLIL